MIMKGPCDSPEVMAVGKEVHRAKVQERRVEEEPTRVNQRRGGGSLLITTGVPHGPCNVIVAGR